MTLSYDQRDEAKYRRLQADIVHAAQQLAREHYKKRPNYARIQRLTNDLNALKEQRANEYGP